VQNGDVAVRPGENYSTSGTRVRLRHHAIMAYVVRSSLQNATGTKMATPRVPVAQTAVSLLDVRGRLKEAVGRQYSPLSFMRGKT
jgi:hypothetical protein